jgi:tRNA-dihydrouridine synthase 1
MHAIPAAPSPLPLLRALPSLVPDFIKAADADADADLCCRRTPGPRRQMTMAGAFPPLPRSSAQVRADQARASSHAEHERLELAAASALSLGAAAVSTLLAQERSAFELNAPDLLRSLRQAAAGLRETVPARAERAVSIQLGALLLPTPVWTVAPMVTQCDAPFRLLTRRYGARLVYSEMLMADQFAASADYRAVGLGLRGDALVVPEADHPLVVQFAANEPATLLAAALEAQRAGADAVDINLGCPQNRARDGHYGSFLHDRPDWPLVCAMVAACAGCAELTIPICCKIRLQPALEDTIEFALQLQAAGCALLAVHGRRRGNESHRRSGPADLNAIAAIKAALSIPVLSNGNVSSFDDALQALHATGADGVMSAEEVLRDPAVFARCDLALGRDGYELGGPPPAGIYGEAGEDGEAGEAGEDAPPPDALLLASEYLALCLQHEPSSVWSFERSGSTAHAPSCDVARHHLSRLLQNRADALGFLAERETLAACTLPRLASFFERHFASALEARRARP